MNRRPTHYEGVALPTELLQHEIGVNGFEHWPHMILLVCSLRIGGPGWSRTSRAVKHLIYSQARCLLRDTDPYLPLKAAWRSKEDSNLQPLAEHSLSKRADYHYHIAACFARRNYFHTISSTATAQETGRTGKRVTDVFMAVRVGVEPTRQLSLSACFRDRMAQPLAVLTMWRSEQDSNLQAAFAVRPISNRVPFQIGLITPSLITNSIAIRTHRRLALDQKKTICTYFEADLRDRYDAYDR